MQHFAPVSIAECPDETMRNGVLTQLNSLLFLMSPGSLALNASQRPAHALEACRPDENFYQDKAASPLSGLLA